MSHNKVTVTALIPTYNRAALLKRALSSVYRQRRQVDEVIVVDDGSTDATRAVVEQYPNIRYLYQQNGGVSRARNLGIRAASSQWIAFLDSDDEWRDDKIELQLQAIECNTHAQICHSNEIWIRNGKPLNQLKKHKKSGGDIFRQCLPLCVISPSAVMIKKQLFYELGLFNVNMPVCEDYDMWLRICAQYPVLYLDEALITKYGGHADQLSSRYWGMDWFRVRSLYNLIRSRQILAAKREAAVQCFMQKCQILSLGAEKHGNDTLLDSVRILQQHLRTY